MSRGNRTEPRRPSPRLYLMTPQVADPATVRDALAVGIKSADVAAVLLPGPAEDEATVKRIRRQRGKVVLVPENPSMEPFAMDPEGRILGKVVAVLRKL